MPMTWPRASNKRTYYELRGKVHLAKDDGKAYCGNDLGQMNHHTTVITETTCQKCLMIRTKDPNWKSEPEKKKKKKKGKR